MGRRRQDHYARQAQRDRFPARSVYKLEEIDRRTRLVRPGRRVLDLGAAPGSWSLYLARGVGPGGFVLAIDLQPLRVELPANAHFLRGSCFDLGVEIAAAGPFDLVVSDMAPSTTGDRGTDQYRSFELFSGAVDLAAAHGRPGSDFAGKIFQGPSFEEARVRLRGLYAETRVLRPKATRTESYEVFLVGLGRRLPDVPEAGAPG
ncbi:MAG: RlmE family RNA methyltransferase [Deltaproteobacteria bacterium]|nr:RlmE family RNA methyltransferase [Deltaproteobacteria bacterium]